MSAWEAQWDDDMMDRNMPIASVYIRRCNDRIASSVWQCLPKARAVRHTSSNSFSSDSQSWLHIRITWGTFKYSDA